MCGVSGYQDPKNCNKVVGKVLKGQVSLSLPKFLEEEEVDVLVATNSIVRLDRAGSSHKETST